MSFLNEKNWGESSSISEPLFKLLLEELGVFGKKHPMVELPIRYFIVDREGEVLDLSPEAYKAKVKKQDDQWVVFITTRILDDKSWDNIKCFIWHEFGHIKNRHESPCKSFEFVADKFILNRISENNVIEWLKKNQSIWGDEKSNTHPTWSERINSIANE